MRKLDEEDRILAHELGKVGGVGYAGAWLGGIFLRKDVSEVSFEMNISSSVAAERAHDALLRAGRLVASDDAHDPIRGIVKAGHLNMNPALVSITLTPLTPGTTRAHVRGVAKEGLIKQRASEKAAKRIVQLMSS